MLPGVSDAIACTHLAVVPGLLVSNARDDDNHCCDDKSQDGDNGVESRVDTESSSLFLFTVSSCVRSPRSSIASQSPGIRKVKRKRTRKTPKKPMGWTATPTKQTMPKM